MMHLFSLHYMMLVSMPSLSLLLYTVWLILDIRKNLRVTMFNLLMLEEAGIGKGVTREFLCELLKESFDPDKGLFRCSDQKELFPNPQVTHMACYHNNMILLQADMIIKDYPQHYHFIGRLLGKALYENLLVDLPLAGFFLCKIIGGGVCACVCVCVHVCACANAYLSLSC